MKVNPLVMSSIHQAEYKELIQDQKNQADDDQVLGSREDSFPVVVKNNSRFTICFYNRFKILWDILIVILAIYLAVVLPLFIAFYEAYMRSLSLQIVHIVISVIFIIDIMASLRTTYIHNVTLNEVFKSHKIIKHYLLSIPFVLDLVAVIPYELFSPMTLSLLRCVKIYKLFNLTNLIMVMRINNIFKLTMKFFIIIGFLMLFIHFTACDLFLILKTDENWIPPEDYPSNSTSYFLLGIPDQYWVSLYHSVYFVAGINNGGENMTQIVFFSCFYMVGAVLVAIILGNMTFIIRSARKNDTNFNETYNTLNTAMRNLRLGSTLRYKITEFFTANYNILKFNKEYIKFLDKLPPSLMREVNEKSLFAIIKKNPLFNALPKLLKFALVRLKSAFFQPGVYLINQFDEPSNLYFIAHGVCNIEVIDEEKKNHLIGQLNEGDHFGEVSLLYNNECTASVMTVTYTNLAMLSPECFNEMIDVYPDVKDVFSDQISKYHDNWKVFLKNTIRRVPFLSKLDQRTLSHLIYSLKHQRFDAGEILTKEGSNIDSIFFIIEGEVEIYTTIYDRMASNIVNGHEKSILSIGETRKAYKLCLRLGSLPMGSCIFPRLLINKGDLLVSVRALVHTHALLLTEDILEYFIKDSQTLSESIKAYKEGLYKFDKIRNELLPIQYPIDIIKNYKYSNGMNKIAWSACLKMKNVVLRIINIRRRSQIKKVTSFKRMVKKLKAMNYLEQIGKYELARMIANDKISEDVVKVLELLEDDELGNELLRQFALKANETSAVCEFLSGRLKSCRKKVRKLTQTYEEVDALAGSIERLLIEALRMSKKV